MTDKAKWTSGVSKILKSEMKKRGITYAELSSRLDQMNVSITAEDLRVRASRGTFGATLFVQCLIAMGVTTLYLDPIYFESQSTNQT
jgi:hypothetical protein